jgi:acetoacetyl-CoA synthetase
MANHAPDASCAGPGEVDWLPPTGRSQLTSFAEDVSRLAGRDLVESYQDLWRWSVDHVDDFWSAVWDHFGVGDRPSGPVLVDEEMPGARWFAGTQLNLVAQIFKGRCQEAIAVVAVNEAGDVERVSWGELEREVASVAEFLTEMGIAVGDSVCGYLPNTREAVVAFLATASLGAVWASCGIDYPAPAAVDRLAQLAPKVLFAARTVRYAGRERDLAGAIIDLVSEMPSVGQLVMTGDLSGIETPRQVAISQWSQITAKRAPLRPRPVPFDHPLWVLFSSGTTGKPKGIVHGHGGVLLEYLKIAGLHMNLTPDDRLLWYASPSWMMWNFQVACMVSGCSVVCYSGSPEHPAQWSLWRVGELTGATWLGMSPAYLERLRKSDSADFAYPSLRAIGVTGSVFAPELHRWLRCQLPPAVQIFSSSGGTDVVTAFLAGAPNVPVYVGELSAVCLGVALDVVDAQGQPVRGEPGELVIRRPMPSMPLYFLSDPDGSRLKQSYFDRWPGIWRHGDRITMTDRGTVVIHGRSDATLNRNGVRLGTADIYGPVEDMPEIADSLVVGVETTGGGYWMPLFVTVRQGWSLDSELRQRIVAAIRQNASARHIPDEIIAAPAIPRTRTGKKLEVPIKFLLAGMSAEDVLDPKSVDQPEALRWFAQYAASRRQAHIEEN